MRYRHELVEHVPLARVVLRSQSLQQLFVVDAVASVSDQRSGIKFVNGHFQINEDRAHSFPVRSASDHCLSCLTSCCGLAHSHTCDPRFVDNLKRRQVRLTGVTWHLDGETS